MKTIVFLIEQAINMGPENVVLDICRCIDRSKYKPIIFSLRDEDTEKTIEPKFKALGIEVLHFGMGMVQQELLTWSVSCKVKKAFNEVGGDILHAHCYHPQLIASLMKGVKTVSTIHNISGEDFIMKKGKELGGYMKWRFDRSLANIDWSIAISDYMMEYYAGMCKKLTKIPNGVSFRKNDNFNSAAFKTSLDIDNNKCIIVVTGSISARKNVSYLVSELKQSVKDFLCLIIGAGDKMEECKQLAANDNRFRFEGYRPNVSDYLSIADLYLSASKSEGLPLSVLEAINMGVPCLLSDIRPHKEIEENMSVDGVSCFPLSSGALTSTFNKAICTCFNHKAIEQKASQIYSAEVMTKEYEKIYSTL